MRISSTRDLAATVRGRRQELRLSQAELATRAQVSREWISGVEQGKATVEFGLVLRLLDALGLSIDLSAHDPTPTTARIDLDALLGELEDR
jgi:y4mF family transcriptional regulator